MGKVKVLCKPTQQRLDPITLITTLLVVKCPETPLYTRIDTRKWILILTTQYLVRQVEASNDLLRGDTETVQCVGSHPILQGQ